MVHYGQENLTIYGIYMSSKFVSLVNGPNLNLLGTRQPEIYGTTDLNTIEQSVRSITMKKSLEVEAFQSNHEGAIIDYIQGLDTTLCKGMLLNPGALMMNGYGLYDALANFSPKVIEVHISNIYQREQFRHKSVLASITNGQITGLGVIGYQLAAYALLDAEKGPLND